MIDLEELLQIQQNKRDVNEAKEDLCRIENVADLQEIGDVGMRELLVRVLFIFVREILTINSI